MRRANGQERLTEDFEWEQCIKAFTQSSDRARYVMVILVVGSFIAMFAWNSARDPTWMDQRIKMKRVAQANEVWNLGGCTPLADSDLSNACEWFRSLGIDKAVFEREISPKMEEVDLEHRYYAHFPFLDATFDVNDLGIVTGSGSVFIVLVLLLSMLREHENLYLCLRRVTDKFKDEKELADDGRSRANLFYHALAMAQVFSNPPTLGRWRRNLVDGFPDLMFFATLLPQALIFYTDFTTRPIGDHLKHTETIISLVLQGACILLVLSLSGGCLLCSMACDKKWKRCFSIINPSFAKLPKTSPVSWMEVSYFRRIRVNKQGPDGSLKKGTEVVTLKSQLARKGLTRLRFVTLENRNIKLDNLIGEDPAISTELAIGGPEFLGTEHSDVLVADRWLLRKWRSRHLACAVVDSSLRIHRLEWWTHVIEARVSLQRQAAAAKESGEALELSVVVSS